MADTGINIQIRATTKEAQDAISRLVVNADKSAKGIDGAFKGIKLAGFVAGITAIGVALKRGIGAAIAAAEEQENSIRKLEFALKSTGEFTKGLSLEFQDFADSLQRSTGVSDDAVLGQLALAKQFGFSNSQAKNLVKTAVDLSAVTGDDLNTSFDKLMKTYSGTTGELGKLIPGVKALTKEQLASGAAVDLVGGKVRGAAFDFTNTFSGAVKLASSNFDEFLEAIGGLITSNPLVLNAIKATSDAFASLADLVKSITPALNKLAKVFDSDMSAAFAGIAPEEAKKIAKIAAQRKAASDKAQADALAQSTAAKPGEKPGVPFTRTQEEAILPKQQLTLLNSAIQGIGQGAAGVASALSSMGGFVVDTFLPGMGAIASQALQILAQGPDAAAGFVKGFIEGIPQIIENIILAIPAILDVLPEALANMISELIQRLPEIAVRFATSLSNQSGFIATRFTIELIKHIPEIVKGMAEGALQAFKDAFKDIGNVLGIGGGGGGIFGGIGSAVGSVGSVFGFAHGGTPRFSGGDNIMAGFRADELVIDKTDTDRLSRFLDRQEQGSSSKVAGPQQVTLNVTVPASEISEAKFAQYIFNLSRNGFRLAGA